MGASVVRDDHTTPPRRPAPSRLGPDDADLIASIRRVLDETWFSAYDPAFLATPAGKDDVDAQVFRRYNDSVDYVLPWVGRHLDLAGKDVVEVGCGTGSSTAAFAAVAGAVHAYDVDERSVLAARRRLAVMGLHNVSLHHHATDEMLDRIVANHGHGTDVVLLYAVLEHMTLAERLAFLTRSWELIRDGGLLVVVETPNRLTFCDHHTSQLPFFQMLPDDLALLYVEHSPRGVFRDAIRDALGRSREEALLTLTRWGRGISYHEFEVALGDIAPLIVSSGYEPEMTAWFPLLPEEHHLRDFVADRGVPLAFTRHVLNVILRKGGRLSEPGSGAVEPMPTASSAPSATAYERLLDEHTRLLASRPIRLSRALARYPFVRRLGAAGFDLALLVRRALARRA